MRYVRPFSILGGVSGDCLRHTRQTRGECASSTHRTQLFPGPPLQSKSCGGIRPSSSHLRGALRAVQVSFVVKFVAAENCNAVDGLDMCWMTSSMGCVLLRLVGFYTSTCRNQRTSRFYARLPAPQSRLIFAIEDSKRGLLWISSSSLFPTPWL